MTPRSASPVSVFLFIVSRTVRNAARQRLRRLKEPRYLIGLAFGLLYFTAMFLRPGARPGRYRPPGVGSVFSPEIVSLIVFAGAYAFAVVSLVSWILRKGKAALPLSETDIQFLFPAPLPARAVLHYAFLRTQLGLLVSSLILTLVFRRGIGSSGIRGGIATWILLSVLQFHLQALAFTKARWDELPALRRRLFAVGVPLVAAVLLAALTVFSVDAWRLAAVSLSQGRIESIAGLERSFGATRWGAAPLVLLAPFRAVLQPIASTSLPGFLKALPAALGILVLHYVWLVGSSVRYEEATLDLAARRAQLRARRSAGRTGLGAPPGKRHLVPFALAPKGFPELALVWKNLLCLGRFPLRRLVAVLVALALPAYAAGWFLRARLGSEALVVAALSAIALLTLMVAQTIPFALRNDLRADLEQAPELRLWPLAPARLVAGELAAPWLLSSLYLLGGLGLSLALAAGASFGRAGAPLPADRQGATLEPWLALGRLVPAALGAAILLPALTAVVLFVQNGAVLSFPAWFPPGRKRVVGLEATGMRLLSLLVTSLLVVVAAIPAALVAVPAVLLLGKPLGFWVVPVAALGAALPLYGEAALGVVLLGRLWERFDPALDLNA